MRSLFLTLFLLPMIFAPKCFSQDARNYYVDLARYYGSGEYTEAISTANYIIKYYPDFNLLDDVYNERGLSKRMLKDFIGALEDFSTAIILRPKNNIYYFNRGLAKIDLNQTESACRDFNKAFELGGKRAAEMIARYCQ